MSRLVGHYAPWLLAVVVGVLIALTLAPALTIFIGWEVLILLLAAVGFLAFSIFAHNRRLCERCIASMPLDASTVASRYAVRFRIAHLFERRVFAGCYLGAVVGSSFLYDHPIGRYAWAAAQVSLVYLLRVYVTHQRLQPWCPYCKHGGEERTVPTHPAPVSTQL
jgi:high-affinity Fe2+/Pb2+ permease